MYNHAFFATVVDVNDPEQAGRVKIRVDGDQAQLKDDELRWARPIFPITNPIRNRTGTAITGLQKGSKVYGFFIDNDKQIPYVIGTIGSSGRAGSTIDDPQFPRDMPVPNSNQLPPGGQFPIGDRRIIQAVANGIPQLASQSLPLFSMLQAGTGPARNANVQTIGTRLPNGFNAIDFIKKIDANNSGGTLGPTILNLIKNFQQSQNKKLTDMVGGAQLINQAVSFVNQLMQSQNNNITNDQKNSIIDIINKIITNIKAIGQQNYYKNVPLIQEYIMEINSISVYNNSVSQILQLSTDLPTVSRDNMLFAIQQILDELEILKRNVGIDIPIEPSPLLVVNTNATDTNGNAGIAPPPDYNDTYYY